MITKQMESINDADLLVMNKLCKVLGCEPVESPHPAVSARRNLFGCLEDSSAINELLLQQAAELAERSARDWNFDFISGTPLSGGRYVWERVGDSPQFYAGACVEDCEMSTDSVIGEKENTLIIDVCANNKEPKCGSNSKIKCNDKARLVQTSLKGYMQTQKRRTSKRLRSKCLDARYLKRCNRVANYILDAAGSSKRS